jgi:Skp family chaperone for outer membrane proteins
MKPRLLPLFGASLILGIAAIQVHADLPNQRKAIDDLQAAKKSSDPMPLLQSAKKHLAQANKGNKAGDRDDALDKVKEAIAELKAGDRQKMEQKINAAISNIHQGKDKSKSK